RRELLPVQRRRQPGADDHGECPAGRRSPDGAPVMTRRALLLLFASCALLFGGDHGALVTAVDSIGLTVSDLDRSVEFYSKVLSFEKVSETEVDGDPYEHLTGVFGVRMRVARMKLGDEAIELTEFLAPKGRPAPPDARSNDRWFQHVAIIVSDM